MREKIISILKVSISLFVIMYTFYIYRMTRSISLVTLVILLAGLAPVLHMAWTYLKIKIDDYEDVRYIRYLKR
nr:intracellular septation protein [uncultured Blautia sp.]